MTIKLRTLAVSLIGVFASCAAPRLASVSPQRSQADPLMASGDLLRIAVWRHPELSGEFVIGTDSTLVHPVYQVIKVGGAPLSVDKERLRRLLVTYEQDVQIVIEPLFPVTVAGEVRQPNLYRLPQGTTIAQAVALAGGPTEQGRLDKIRLIRRDGEITIDLAHSYAKYETLLLGSGDQLLVTRRGSFSVLRDLFLPVASLTAAVAAVISAQRR